MAVTHSKDTLWTKSYVFMCLSNFLVFFAFYLLMPTLPFYLTDMFHTSKGMVGLVLSSYTIAVLAIRPFSGFLADTFARKPMYLIAYFLFTTFFVGYLLAGVLSVFVAVRIFQGFAFGTVSTSGNTLVIDIMPSSRRGEGLGYYGAINNLALAFGPMVGLFLMDTGSLDSFNNIFYTSILSGSVGLCFALMVKTPPKLPREHEAISLDRFFLLKGLSAAIPLVLITLPYGMTSTYIAMYAEKSGLGAYSGLFFLVMSVGLILSRITSGKKVDQGQLTRMVQQGFILVCIGVVMEVLLQYVAVFHVLAGYGLFFTLAFLLGYGYGTLIPAMNTLFINLAPHNRRATANATYLTSWDMGIGGGILLGGALSEWVGFSWMYAMGAVFALIALFLYIRFVIPHFEKNRLR